MILLLPKSYLESGGRAEGAFTPKWSELSERGEEFEQVAPALVSVSVCMHVCGVLHLVVF